MCGITGFITTARWQEAEMTAVCQRMSSRIQHRGPDSEGVWTDAGHGVALGHRRLSIQDLSVSGYQPMSSRCGRFVLVFNGEIYNHHDIRQQLRTHVTDWRGHSDTETVVESVSAWGIERTLALCSGMFAMAIWDRQSHSLTLARDRFGEKPLYYAKFGDTFLFASELKALQAHPCFTARICPRALSGYFSLGFVPEPLSIHQNVFKLPPGTSMCFEAAKGLLQPPRAYWRIDDKHTPETPTAASIETLLRAAVQRQLIGDVPLGAFLSGGIDSTLVVALMQDLSPRPVNTFTIGFEQAGYDEAQQAGRVARHLGTHHTALYLREADLLAAVPTIASIYDEPFADASQVPTAILCRLARQHVTVALTGDGADELFGGYRRHTEGPLIWRLAQRLPMALRQGVGRLIESTPPGLINTLPAGIADLTEKTQKVARLLAARSHDELYMRLTTHEHGHESVVLDATQGDLACHEPITHMAATASLEQQLMGLDIRGYLPGDILVKVDRAAMAVGLETRAPFLDHQLAQAAWELPMAEKIQGRRGKMVLRGIMAKYIPPHLIAPAKRGFTPPVGEWLKGALRPWVEDLLHADTLHAQGLLDVDLVRRRWREHQSGRRNWTYQLWDVLMFQSWLALQSAHMNDAGFDSPQPAMSRAQRHAR